LAHIRASAFANAIESDHLQRELVVVPLPEDTGLGGDGRPRVRRYQLDLGQRLAAFPRATG
jgi:hypothetical protein